MLLLVQMMSGLQCKGVGSSKKAAKKEAADKMLSLLQEDGECYDAIDAPQVDNSLSRSYLIHTTIVPFRIGQKAFQSIV